MKVDEAKLLITLVGAVVISLAALSADSALSTTTDRILIAIQVLIVLKMLQDSAAEK